MTFRRNVECLLSCSILVVCLPLTLLAQPTARGGVSKVIPLDSGWEFRQRTGGPVAEPPQWRPAQVPGDVHLDLLQNKLIPDPFYRDNESKLQWIEDADWEYRTTIQATPEVLKYKKIELVFEGLDAYAEVYVNDQRELTADNMFREWRVDAKPLLKAGDNRLLIVFPSPVRTAAEIATRDKWRVRTLAPEKAYVRKAAYEFGWDWGPRFVTSGIWRPVRLELWDETKISNLYIRQSDISAAVAHLAVEVEVTASEAVAGKVVVSYEQAGKKTEVARTVAFEPGLNHFDLPIDIDKPDLWYPAGYGAQPIYAFDAKVIVEGRVENDSVAHAGLRSVVLRREVDQWGRSFEFIINGIPVFAKGADVIPFDSFPNRVTTERYRQILQSARDANMNMIRHWGGGYYEADEFYELCDELGIMIWQDFMFGNDWQPGTYGFKENVAKEAEYQVRRLRNHPSIVLWCGNNETESSWGWGRNPALRTDAELAKRMWQDYLTLFSGVLASTVERLNPETPYWPSSPSADYEDTSEDYESGDMHDWSVWHGRVPFSEYEKHFPRFMTEYGFQSFPEMRTVEAFTQPDDRTDIFTPVMLAHQKNNAGNAIIHDYMLRYYSEPKDFASFLYASQVLQAEGIKVGAEHLRRLRPRAMGSIFWQLNDCWPVASWSSIDYYGRWKALQYYARRFYNDLLVSPHMENGQVAVYVVSDRITPTTANLRVRLMTFDGTILSEKSQVVDVPALSSKAYIHLPMEEFTSVEGYDAAKTFVAADLTVGGKSESTNLYFFLPSKGLELPAPQVTSDLRGTNGIFQLRLSSNVLARDVYVSAGSLDVTYSDNYFDLLPGESVTIKLKSPATLEQLRLALKVNSLVDAFRHSPTAANAP
jgi:beta-mannosidase